MPQIDTQIYKSIRRLYVIEGMSIRGIARRLNINRRTVRKYCMGEVDPDTRKEYQIINSSFRDILEKNIIEIIETNKNSPKKQSLNAKIIYQMLVKMGYCVGESTIRKYIRELRIKKPEVFIPLEFAPGEAMEFDWGDSSAYINEIKARVSLFCAVLPYSFGIFCAVFPDKTNSSFYAGNIMAFEYFGGVPLRCIYDNLRSAVLNDWGKNAIKQEKFKKLEAHYAFDGILCNKAKGNEKGSVENLVSIVRQIALTPMPRVKDYEELQEHITQKCTEYCMNHKIKNKEYSIKEMLEEEKKHLLPLPLSPLDPSPEVKALVHPDLTVRSEGIKYSVPKAFIGLTVTLKVSPFKVDIYFQGSLIYSHKKAFRKGDHQYVTEHYLDILDRKPRAINNAAPIIKGQMPDELSEFLRICKSKDKNHQLVNIFLLGKKISRETLFWAVRQANSTGAPSYDLVCFYLEIQESKNVTKFDSDIKVDSVDFGKYDELIEGREKYNEK